MASPRVCCAGEKDAREVAAHGRTRVEREETALGEGACRDSIVRGGCAQLSRKVERDTELRLILDLFRGEVRRIIEELSNQAIWVASFFGRRGRP